MLETLVIYCELESSIANRAVVLQLCVVCPSIENINMFLPLAEYGMYPFTLPSISFEWTEKESRRVIKAIFNFFIKVLLIFLVR